jgi:photosystem II stability/assembly factor-like uncharacterized protein
VGAWVGRVGATLLAVLALAACTHTAARTAPEASSGPGRAGTTSVVPHQHVTPSAHPSRRRPSFSISAVRAFPSGRVLVAGEAGTGTDQRTHVFVSGDNGATFADVTPDAIEERSSSFVDDMVSLGPDRLWVLTWDADSTRSTLYRSADRGHTWHAAAAPGHNESAGSTDSLAFDDARHAWLVQQMPNGPVSTLYATSDGGASWREVNRQLPQVAPVASDPATGLWQGGGFFGGFLTHSTDGGHTWVADGPTPAPGRGAASSRPGLFDGHVLVAVGTLSSNGETVRFYETTDAGHTWRELSRVGPLPHEPTVVGVVRRAQTTIASPQNWWVVASDPHPVVYTTTDSGTNWSHHRLPVPGPALKAPFLQITASDPQHAWVLVNGNDIGHLLSTSDGGQTWTEVHPDQPDSTAAHTALTTAPTCRSRQLTAHVALSGSVMSQPFATIALRNHSPRPCTLRGYPRLTIYGHGARGPVTRLAIRPHQGSIYERDDPGPHRVLLAPRQAATFTMGTATAFQGGLHMLTITRLAITPPGDTSPLTVHFQMYASHPPDAPIPVGITALQLGTGT